MHCDAMTGDLRTCRECVHFFAPLRRCDNHHRAGLRSPELGLDLPRTPQRCPGFRVRTEPAAPATPTEG